VEWRARETGTWGLFRPTRGVVRNHPQMKELSECRGERKAAQQSHSVLCLEPWSSPFLPQTPEGLSSPRFSPPPSYRPFKLTDQSGHTNISSDIKHASLCDN